MAGCHHAPMEYGRVVGESTGTAGGRGGGTGDVTGQIMNSVSDAIDQVASLPAEVLVGAAIVGVVLLVLIRR